MDGPAACPRCGQSLAGEAACPRCGVIFAKLRPRDPAEAAREISAPAVDAGSPSDGSRVPWGLVVGFAALIVAGVVGLPRLRSGGVEPPAAPIGVTAAKGRVARVSTGATEEPPPPPAAPALAPETIDLPLPEAGSDPDDQQVAELTRRVNQRAAIGAADVRAVEDLLARRPADPDLRRLAVAVLLAAAEQERGVRRYAQAIAYLDRATAVDPGNYRPWLALMAVSNDAGDWTRAEAAARGAIAVDSGLPDAWYGLGYALMRQDRNREAAEALRTAVGLRPDADTQALLARVLAGLDNEKGMTEQQLSHFHVRYDGDAHEAVGREILRALERHYATLASTLDHQPETAIPVILFSRQSYYNANGAPAWSGGNYDVTDGRIRIPIGGLDAGLTPNMDGTLLHELTHAFIHDRTHGIAPRELHEGLAQYMEGKRVASELSGQEMQWLADGRIQGVAGFYFGALSFVEYLVTQRGMGGVNDLLKAMGETGSVDEAYKQVHGQTQRAVEQAWRQRLRQQHGS